MDQKRVQTEDEKVLIWVSAVVLVILFAMIVVALFLQFSPSNSKVPLKKVLMIHPSEAPLVSETQ